MFRLGGGILRTNWRRIRSSEVRSAVLHVLSLAQYAAVYHRLLPIFLTSSTTIGGLIPLALFGGPMWKAMAWLLILGLAIATLLTLLLLPAIYAVFVEALGMTLVREDSTKEY